MKKGVKIALGIVGVLVVGGAALAAWQWNNLNALRYGLTLDRDTIDQKLQDNQQALNDAMAEYNIQGRFPDCSQHRHSEPIQEQFLRMQRHLSRTSPGP